MIGGFHIRAECYNCWCLPQKGDTVKVFWTEMYQIFPVITLFSYSRTAYLTHFRGMELLWNKKQRLMKIRKPCLGITPFPPPEYSLQNFSKMRGIIPLGCGGWGREAYIFSHAVEAKNISIYFMNEYAFIHMTLNEAVHVITHWNSHTQIWASIWITQVRQKSLTFFHQV